MYIPSFATVSTLLISCITYVNANAAVTAPVESKWKAGSKNIITWQENNKAPPMPAKFDIALMRGEMIALQLVSTINKDTDSSLGQYTWEIPAGQEPGSDYAIRLGNSPDYVYSSFFTILSSDGTSAGSSSPNTGSGTTTTPPAKNESSSNNQTANGAQGDTNNDKSGGLINTATVASALVVVGSVAFNLI